MSLLTPQSNGENAAQTVPRTGLPSNDQHPCVQTLPLAHALGSTRQNRESQRVGTGMSKLTGDANDDRLFTFCAGHNPREYFPQGAPLGLRCF
jgi:hypothetical protein